MFRFENFNSLKRISPLSDPQFNTGVSFKSLNCNTLPSSLHDQYLLTPSFLENFCAILIHQTVKSRLIISHSRCTFLFLQILKNFLNIVTKSYKKIKTLYASILWDLTNNNDNMKNLRNFETKAIKGHWFTELEVTPLWQCDNVDSLH
jgi:hypothetical protein